jgi:hypothetical protein
MNGRALAVGWVYGRATAAAAFRRAHIHIKRENRKREAAGYNTAAWAKVPNNSFYFQRAAAHQSAECVCVSHEPEAADSSSAIVQSKLNSRALSRTHTDAFPKKDWRRQPTRADT